MGFRLGQDVRFGLRMLRKTPFLSIAAILAFGLGIGLTTTVFSIVNGVFYKGLPFEEGSRIVMLWGTNAVRGMLDAPIRARDIREYAHRMSSLEGLGYFALSPMNMTAKSGQPERFTGAQISINTLDILRIRPVIGRGFRRGEGLAGADPVVMISHGIWHNRFGASPNVLGKTIRINGISRTVIGVMPKKFGFPGFEELWVPLEMDSSEDKVSYLAFGRLGRGASLQDAKAQAAAAAADLARMHPDTNQGYSATVRPFIENFLRPQIYAFMYTMLAAGISVLLIACVNVSHLMLARISGRTREFALRMAVGASRSRIFLQLLSEALLLAIAGGAIGFWLSILAVQWFASVLMELNPPPFWMTFEVDYRVLAFVATATLMSGLIAGIMPARRSGKENACEALRGEARASKGLGSIRFSGALVICEVAVSCALLMAAGLLTGTLAKLKHQKMPFAVDEVFTARIHLPRTEYPDSASCVRFYRQLLPRLQSIPGVESAMLADGLPASGYGSVSIQMRGMDYQPEKLPTVMAGIVTPGFFRGFQTPMLRGREFTEMDQQGSLPVAVVNESFVRAFLPDGNPIGRSLRTVRDEAESPWLTIVGTVPDLLMEGLGNKDRRPAGFYIPVAQSDVTNFVSIALRAHDNPMKLMPEVRETVASLNRDLPIYGAMSMRGVIQRQSWFYTVFGTLFLSLGISALFLAMAGLYGVMSFSVVQRTREIGIRAALGAGGTELIRLTVSRGLRRLVMGLALGVALGLVFIRPLQGTLYRMDGNIPGLVAIVLTALVSSGLLANLIPARRAARIKPAAALTFE
jgi:putative ABC transport system permease protein